MDLRSDTVTRPSEGMRRAMAEAVVGDEQRGEDPTVNELERRVAVWLGKEAAVFVPSATMGNHIAALLHGRPGDQLLAESTSHVLLSELGGAAVHAGLATRGLAGERGMVDPDDVRVITDHVPSAGAPRTAMVVLENTHNAAGGAILPQEIVEEVARRCRERRIAVHLDGARLWNAAVGARRPVKELAAPFDTVTVCLSKGLGCPGGALIVGPVALMTSARRYKRLLGGAMRQAGILAAAGVYALEHHVDRLADDHRRAGELASSLRGAGIAIVDADRVETNIVQIDVSFHGLTCVDAIGRLRRAGIGLSPTPRPAVIRAVTHLDVGDEDVRVAIGCITRALDCDQGKGCQSGTCWSEHDPHVVPSEPKKTVGE